MQKIIDADAFLRRVQNQHKCYIDEEMRRQMWWFTNKFLPAALADEPTVELEVKDERASVVSRKKYNEVVYKLECLLWYATGGRYSKAGYSLRDMERMVNEHIQNCIDDAFYDTINGDDEF